MGQGFGRGLRVKGREKNKYVGNKGGLQLGTKSLLIA